MPAEQTKMEQAGQDMLYLVNCAIHGSVPENRERLKGMDIESVYKFSKFHSLSAITYMALEPVRDFLLECGNNANGILDKWQEDKDKAVRKNILLDGARFEIFQFMEERGIWYMPLKGIRMKELYPKIGMRQMADNDILYDKAYQDEVKVYMESKGYETVSFKKFHHDVYEKPPVYNFELHTSLHNASYKKDWFAYYSNVKERLIKDEGNKYGYHFSNEDFYIYMITHTYKHFDGGGTGVRSLLDIFVFLNKMEESDVKFDREYVREELAQLDLVTFEQRFVSLARQVFEKEEIVAKDLEPLLFDCMYSGTYGTLQRSVQKKLKEIQADDEQISLKTRLKYYGKRLFLSMEYYKEHCPLLYKYKILIPFHSLYRCIRGLLFARKRIWRECVTIWQAGKK